MPNCSYIRDNLLPCTNTHGLNSFFFFNPESQSLEKTSICQLHSDEILKMMLEEIRGFQNNITRLYGQISARRYNTITFDISFDNSALYSEIKSEKEKITRVRWQFCRWPICKNRKFFYDELIYSCIVFSTFGRMRHIFYFHKKCWDSFRGRCGIKLIQERGQKTLEMSI